MAAWGVEYKTVAFNWVKTCRSGEFRMGMGYYTRSGSELCLLGIKGRMKPKDRGVRQVFTAETREHSRKPDETYYRIEGLYDGPYMELFARQRQPGWDAWGKETDKFAAGEDVAN